LHVEYLRGCQCLWTPDRCSNGAHPDAAGQCHVATGTSLPTKCSNSQQFNSAGKCFSPPQCINGYKYDIPSRLCVPSTWPVDCTDPSDARHLNQEGWTWSIPPSYTTTTNDRTNHGTNIVTKANSTGFVVQWIMPGGSITGYHAGVYYNPVNFYQNVPSDTTGHKYMFYQVDYGIGKVLGNRQGWFMTFEAGGSGDYPFIQLKEVPVLPGSKYWISGVLEPLPLANPPAYVVQIVQGTHSWVYKTRINEIQPRTSPVYKFLSFQDQWISTPFASNLTRDEISYPTIISIAHGNQISLGGFLTSATPYSSLEPASITSSFKLLSPHLMLSSQHSIYTNSRDCKGFGNPSTDTADLPGALPSDPLTGGQQTTIRIPATPP